VRVLFIAFVLLLSVASWAEPQLSARPIRGMTISCPWWGETWGTAHMQEALRELTSLGVGWAALHPYARIRRDGSIQRFPAAEVPYLGRAVSFARERGATLFWTPHLAHWGSFSWSGAIEFGEDAEAWKRFFDGYEQFIVDQARFAEAARVPLFSVGVELERTVAHEAEWRRIIRAVRAVYRGKLTYSANWDGVHRVPFWDAVDLIGVQAYFPLADEVAPFPSEKQIEARWTQHLERLKALSDAHGEKPVLFTELGFSRSREAATKPWLPRVDDGAEVIGLRQRLIETSLRVIEREPRIAGVFFWKWIPGRLGHDRDFSMRDPEAIAALRTRWASAKSR
jgi:hypothetical protein